MKPTLQERLVEAAKHQMCCDFPLYMDSDFDGQAKQIDSALEKIILHTIEQTIKEGCEVIANLENNLKERSLISPLESHRIEDQAYGYGVAKADTQHALRGIIK